MSGSAEDTDLWNSRLDWLESMRRDGIVGYEWPSGKTYSAVEIFKPPPLDLPPFVEPKKSYRDELLGSAMGVAHEIERDTS